MTYDELFRPQPFRIRKADEYDAASILNLFVSLIEGLATPFAVENVIVKGRMGSERTMYLVVSHACYLSGC